jgi:hypothetical protein
MLPLI